MNYTKTIAIKLKMQLAQVEHVIQMLNEGNTIPFMARYRKERTGNLDEVQLRAIRDDYHYFQELEARKQTVLKTITEQKLLTSELQVQIEQTLSKQELEDLYLPYKPKRKTKATQAEELGLRPLALLIKEQRKYDHWLAEYLPQHLEMNQQNALTGAQYILAEWMAEDAVVKNKLRKVAWQQTILQAKKKAKAEDPQQKFTLYYDYQEAITKIPAHRFLALMRGENEKILQIKFQFPSQQHLEILRQRWINPHKDLQDELQAAVHDSYQRLILPALENEIRSDLKDRADHESIATFSQNLRDLFLMPPAGQVWVLGLDPGFRNGTKWVVINPTGKMMEYGKIFPHAPQNQITEATAILLKLLQKYPCQFVCIGNGTASREIHQFVQKMIQQNKLQLQAMIVSEAGASVYSASDLARAEFPDLDVAFRGAISIARRFQDPLAELVKIDPKAIGVGQYQHDVNQKQLLSALNETVDSCVNFVGVDLNLASAPLLQHVAGLNVTLAKNIVDYRNQHGAFKNRAMLKKVTRFGEKAFEQSAGFLRIQNGSEPLDQSSVHPEHYALVQKMAADLKITVQDLIGNIPQIEKINWQHYQTPDLGKFTLQDILAELKKPGRDPRAEFQTAKLNPDLQSIKDLAPGMLLEGTITNVTDFGAFVDLGVHQDGLVHISEMANHFVKDPKSICSVGQIVKVEILNLDLDRQRISLSMKTKKA